MLGKISQIRVRLVESRWLVVLGIFTVTMVAYVRTLLPGTVGGDAGELQYAAPLLALPHPTGQPLYVLLGYVWSHIVPIGSMAYRMNLLAAVSGATCCAMLAWAVHKISGNIYAAMGGGLLLGVGSIFWGQAVIADKYAFNGLCASVVAGLAMMWSASRQNGPNDRLLYALSLAYGLSLLHHRSMFVFAPGLMVMVACYERAELWRNWRRTLVCAGLVLLPSLVIYPIYLPWIRAHENSPLLWQPNSASGWIDWWLDREMLERDLFAFDSTETTSTSQQLEVYVHALLSDFTLPGLLISGLGLFQLARRKPASALFLLITFVLVGGFGANYRGNTRQFTYYLPSFVLIAYSFAIGFSELWLMAQTRFGSRLRSKVIMPMASTFVILIIAGMSFAYAYPIRRADAIYGDPMDIWRQTLKSGTLGDRLSSNMAELPQNAILLADWEQVTPLWYEQNVEGVRPDLAIAYPIESLGERVKENRPVCIARHLDSLPDWRLTNIGPLVCLSREPLQAVPQGFVPLGIKLVTPEGQPQLELAGFSGLPDSVPAWTHQPVTLAWRALINNPEDYSISLHLLTEDWQLVWSKDINAPVLGMYPTSRWVSGEVVTDYWEFDIARDVAPGRYLWTVVVYRQAPDGAFIQLRDEQGNVEIQGGTIEITAQSQQ